MGFWYIRLSSLVLYGLNEIAQTESQRICNELFRITKREFENNLAKSEGESISSRTSSPMRGNRLSQSPRPGPNRNRSSSRPLPMLQSQLRSQSPITSENNIDNINKKFMNPFPEFVPWNLQVLLIKLRAGGANHLLLSQYFSLLWVLRSKQNNTNYLLIHSKMCNLIFSVGATLIGMKLYSSCSNHFETIYKSLINLNLNKQEKISMKEEEEIEGITSSLSLLILLSNSFSKDQIQNLNQKEAKFWLSKINIIDFEALKKIIKLVNGNEIDTLKLSSNNEESIKYLQSLIKLRKFDQLSFLSLIANYEMLYGSSEYELKAGSNEMNDDINVTELEKGIELIDKRWHISPDKYFPFDA